MAVTLIGEVVNSCDSVTGFNLGNISTDDDFVEGTGAIGLKASATTVEIYTTTLGATAPYDFSSGGGEFGYHMIMWFNTKTPINSTTGLTCIVGNGTDRGKWDVLGLGFYKGGFITRVINTAADFDTISAGTWTLTGNPAQLSNITQIGGGFTTTTSIMGSFNNVQIDQITIGLGVRVDAGSTGTPNTFETVRAQDEDVSFYGWWSSSNGAIIGKGKCEIGPATGSATSVFTDSAFTVIFANERVAPGFYEITARGAGTDVTWELASISSANASNARWSLTIDSTTLTFSDTNGVWSGADVLTLNSTSTLTGTTLINCTSLIQNTATLDGCVVLSANTLDDVGFITSNDLSKIKNCNFTFSDGHAITYNGTPTATYTFDGNVFTGYGASDSTDASIFNSNTSGTLTINVINGASPTVKTASGGTTVVNNNINITIKVINQEGDALSGAEVSIFKTDGTLVLSSTSADENGEVSQSVSASFGNIVYRVRQSANKMNFLTSSSTTDGVDDTSDTINNPVVHRLHNGDAVIYSKNGGSQAIGLTNGNEYFINATDTTSVTVHSTRASAIAGTGIIALTAGGSETHTLNPVRYFNNSATGTVEAGDFNATITMVRDNIAVD